MMLATLRASTFKRSEMGRTMGAAVRMAMVLFAVHMFVSITRKAMPSSALTVLLRKQLSRWVRRSMPPPNRMIPQRKRLTV